jgi:hypothetical protein
MGIEVPPFFTKYNQVNTVGIVESLASKQFRDSMKGIGFLLSVMVLSGNKP